MLWRRYKDTGDPASRDRLILTFAPLVKYVAGRMNSHLPGPRGGERPHLVRADGPDRRRRALRPRPPGEVRDVRRHAHQGRDHRRAALPRLGAPVRSRPLARDRAQGHRAGAQAAARARPTRSWRRPSGWRCTSSRPRSPRSPTRRSSPSTRRGACPPAASPCRSSTRSPTSGRATRSDLLDVTELRDTLGRRDRPPARAREDRDRPLLLRRADAPGDRRGAAASPRAGSASSTRRPSSGSRAGCRMTGG